jgi:hypothetical protein
MAIAMPHNKIDPSQRLERITSKTEA